MLSGPRFLLLFPLAALIACGSSSSSPSTTPATPTTTPYNFNGNWGAITSYGAGSSFNQYLPFMSLGGLLQVSNGVVTGTFTPSTPYTGINNPNLCAAVNTSLTVTGTLDSNNNLALTFPIAGGTGTLIAALANDPATYASGSWTVNGGACAMSTTNIAIQQIAPTTPSIPTSPATITAPLSGNWAVIADYSRSTINLQPVTGFGGALQFTNGSVTGTLNAYIDTAIGTGLGCQHSYTNAVTVTGTLDANDNLTLTAPIASGTATITATLGSNPQSLADASFQIVGGSCATSATPSTIAQYAPLTGTYKGTFNVTDSIINPQAGNVPDSGTNILVTAVLTQSTTPSANGEYLLTGTVNVTGACTDSETVTSFVSGSSIGSPTLVIPFFWGNFNPTANTLPL
jgi:hypothetical protein